MEEEYKFEIVYMREAINFLNSLSPDEKDKITYNIYKCMVTMDSTLLKKLTGTDIWEFRTLYNGKAYRLFAFWDRTQKRLIVATHGIVKKTMKTPMKEIQHAEQLRRDYLTDKNNQ